MNPPLQFLYTVLTSRRPLIINRPTIYDHDDHDFASGRVRETDLSLRLPNHVKQTFCQLHMTRR